MRFNRECAFASLGPSIIWNATAAAMISKVEAIFVKQKLIHSALVPG